MKAFISYSTTDKHIAGQVKSILDEHGVGSFLAHEDIAVSQEWKERIVSELSDSEIVIPLLSVAFKQSEWAPQEVGVAYGRSEVLFIPLSIDGTMPFGFISDIQGKRIPDSGLSHNLLIDPIVNRFPHEIIPRLIEQLAAARSFRGAEARMSPLVPHFAIFNDSEIDAFAAASIANGQIWDAGECRQTYLPKFLELNRTRLDHDKREALEYQVEHGEWYHLRKDA